VTSFETDLARDLPERLLRLAIGVGCVVDEVDGAAVDDIAQFEIGGLFGAPFTAPR